MDNTQNEEEGKPEVIRISESDMTKPITISSSKEIIVIIDAEQSGASK